MLKKKGKKNGHRIGDRPPASSCVCTTFPRRAWKREEKKEKRKKDLLNRYFPENKGRKEKKKKKKGPGVGRVPALYLAHSAKESPLAILEQGGGGRGGKEKKNFLVLTAALHSLDYFIIALAERRKEREKNPTSLRLASNAFCAARRNPFQAHRKGEKGEKKRKEKTAPIHSLSSWALWTPELRPRKGKEGVEEKRRKNSPHIISPIFL